MVMVCVALVLLIAVPLTIEVPGLAVVEPVRIVIAVAKGDAAVSRATVIVLLCVTPLTRKLSTKFRLLVVVGKESITTLLLVMVALLPPKVAELKVAPLRVTCA